MDYTETESLIAVFQIVTATCIYEQIKIDTEDSFLIYAEKHREELWFAIIIVIYGFVKSILDDRVKQDDILSSKNIDIYIFKSGEIFVII